MIGAEYSAAIACLPINGGPNSSTDRWSRIDRRAFGLILHRLAVFFGEGPSIEIVCELARDVAEANESFDRAWNLTVGDEADPYVRIWGCHRGRNYVCGVARAIEASDSWRDLAAMVHGARRPPTAERGAA